MSYEESTPKQNKKMREANIKSARADTKRLKNMFNQEEKLLGELLAMQAEIQIKISEQAKVVELAKENLKSAEKFANAISTAKGNPMPSDPRKKQPQKRKKQMGNATVTFAKK